jgi:endonuclease/exonuclease/phosphatase (EEP) superfamily protein YafD
MGYFLWPKHWFLGFVLMSIPLLMFLLVFDILFWMLAKPKRALLPVALLVLTWPYLGRTIGRGEVVAPNKNTIKVLSYNLKLFDYYDYAGKVNNERAPKIIEYIINHDADVKVFQEYFNSGKGIFVATKRLEKAGYKYSFLFDTDTKNTSIGGAAIFSKYPIIHSKFKAFESGQNGFMMVDILKGKDTIRIMNVHFYSMGIRVSSLKGLGYTSAKMESKGVFRQLKQGFKARFTEMDFVEKAIKKSPYPIILCGDFNETPYSYCYGKVAKHLSNAFEVAGKGFGFTYNQRPQYIRIDNQFFDQNKFQIVDFELDRIKYSDHYPISVTYNIQQP